MFPKLVSGTMWHFHCCRNSHFKKYFRILKSLTVCHRALIAVIRPNEAESLWKKKQEHASL